MKEEESKKINRCYVNLLPWHQTPTPQPTKCPCCGSTKLWKAGFRETVLGETVQRFMCRNCSYRFSQW